MRFSNSLQALRRFIPRGGFGRSVAVLAGGTALGQTVTILASPLLTRLYDPQDFGIAAVYTSLLSIFSVVASLRYELAIPLPEEEPTAANVLWFSLLMVGLTACVAGLGVWFLGGKLVHLVNSPGLRPFLWLLPLGMALVGTYQVFSYWAIRREAFPRLARTKVTQGVSSVAVQLLFGFAYAGPLGLLLGRVVGQAAGVGTLALLARRRDAEALRAWSWQRMRYVALRYRRFPMLSSGAALINALGLQVPVLLLSSLYGAQVVGHF
ncbi:MAG: oligosaccharide flippase family protein, partial [Candidatus Bipolaricaulota bacterium]